MPDREPRHIRVPDKPVNGRLMDPADLWRVWIHDIVLDPQMDKQRTIEHVRSHVLDHMPDKKDPKARWEEWLAGAYNLLAILGQMYGTDPPHILGVELLHRKWLSSPFEHTPPPVPEPPQRKAARKHESPGS